MIYLDIKHAKNKQAQNFKRALNFLLPVNRFRRGSDFSYIGTHHSYANRELDQFLLTCDNLKFDPDGNLYFLTDDRIDVVTPAECSLPDPEAINVEFIPKKERKIMQEKVVGTTFLKKPLSFDDIAGERRVSESNAKGVPYVVGQAVLMPEPDNKYDANAVSVIAKTVDGKAFKIGYLARGSQLYEETTKPRLAKLIAYGYSTIGSYNDSYVVDVG